MTVKSRRPMFQWRIPQGGGSAAHPGEDSGGWAYIKLGQTAPTPPGGEAQRVKVRPRELSKLATGKTASYLIDEPTTGLQAYDVHKLMDGDCSEPGGTRAFDRAVIDAHLDVNPLRWDWLIDLGPEGGNQGWRDRGGGWHGPKQGRATPAATRGRYLKELLANHPDRSLGATV